MRYGDLRPVVEVYRQGGNVMQALRRVGGVERNTPEIIEIAYDLQAGTYIEHARENADLWLPRFEEMAQAMGPHVADGDSIMEVGTGELTTLAELANLCFGHPSGIYACDLSWSRLRKGQVYARERLRPDLTPLLETFVADMFRLPF